MFPVQAIEEYRPREGQPLLPMPDLEDKEEWEVEEVKDETIIKGEKHYLVKWEGWPIEYNLWVPEKDMGNARRAIQRYKKRQQRLAEPEAKRRDYYSFSHRVLMRTVGTTPSYLWTSNLRKGDSCNSRLQLPKAL